MRGTGAAVLGGGGTATGAIGISGWYGLAGVQHGGVGNHATGGRGALCHRAAREAVVLAGLDHTVGLRARGS